MNDTINEIRFGMIKTAIDAHTLGIRAATMLLEECGYTVFVANNEIENAMLSLSNPESGAKLREWINDNVITNIGFSYRLDPDDAVHYFKELVSFLESEGLYGKQDSQIKRIHFAGLLSACDQIDDFYHSCFVTFRGGEDAETTLDMMGIPKDRISTSIIDGCAYDKKIEAFGKKVIEEGEYREQKPLNRKKYKNFGTSNDTLTERIDNNFEEGFNPLIRAHSGPYRSEWSREDCVKEYISWCGELADKGYLDILSIGSSQLTQSMFGEDWSGIANGGGVPINSKEEYCAVWKASNPMLVRTYSATKNVKEMAKMYDETINNAWHALSLWWFDELDGRGPNGLYDNLREHFDTIKYIAESNGVFEANVPHHFAFRGCDDLTYIVTAVLGAKLAKKMGIKTFVLQNMLNTPRSTWGIQDISKSRALLNIVSELCDDDFRILFQTRAGLDYFKPDINIAKEQLASITALMDDIDPQNSHSPEIIHVVSYSEAVKLATPDIINESIRITRQALKDYRAMKSKGQSFIDEYEEIIKGITAKLENDARTLINAMEDTIVDLYSPEGFFVAFTAGWFPVPELWNDSSDFIYAKKWYTCMKNGGSVLWNRATDSEMAVADRIAICSQNIRYAQQLLEKYQLS